jgi:hypothetical protein
MVHNPLNFEKRGEHALGRATTLPRPLGCWGPWAVPLRRLLFSLGDHTRRPNSCPQ